MIYRKEIVEALIELGADIHAKTKVNIQPGHSVKL